MASPEMNEAGIGDFAAAKVQALQLRETPEFQSFKRKARSAFQDPL
jgi:hypothetical protein